MLQVISNSPETIATAASVGGTAIDVKQAKSVNVVAAVTNSAPAAGTFTAAVTDICTKVAHTYLTGLKVQLTTSGLLPAGLSLATDYFVIKLDADTFKLASSLVNAQAGTAVDITDTGTGTHTITPTALAGASIKLQGCAENVVTASSYWADLPIAATGDASKSGAITATANFMLQDKDPSVCWVRSYLTLTAGQLSVVQNTIVKGDLK